MAHPPYLADLVPCDYWLNVYVKRSFIEEATEKSLARAVSQVVRNIPEEYKKCFDKFFERMELCINNHGDYFGHETRTFSLILLFKLQNFWSDLSIRMC